MSGRHSAASTITALLLIVIWALLLRAGLSLWVDCGKACGFHARASVQAVDGQKAAR